MQSAERRSKLGRACRVLNFLSPETSCRSSGSFFAKNVCSTSLWMRSSQLSARVARFAKLCSGRFGCSNTAAGRLGLAQVCPIHRVGRGRRCKGSKFHETRAHDDLCQRGLTDVRLRSWSCEKGSAGRDRARTHSGAPIQAQLKSGSTPVVCRAALSDLVAPDAPSGPDHRHKRLHADDVTRVRL